MNKIILIGNLGKDPDMNYTTNGIAVTKFTLAVSRKVKAASDSEMKEETEWFHKKGVMMSMLSSQNWNGRNSEPVLNHLMRVYTVSNGLRRLLRRRREPL